MFKHSLSITAASVLTALSLLLAPADGLAAPRGGHGGGGGYRGGYSGAYGRTYAAPHSYHGYGNYAYGGRYGGYYRPGYYGYGWGYYPWSYGSYPGYASYYNYSPEYNYYPYDYADTYSYAPTTSTYQSFYPSETTAPASGALVTVHVPDPNAQVWFDGTATTETGRDRLFTTPTLDPAQTYRYQIQARWMDTSGQPVDQTRQVEFRAGDRVTVDFSVPVTGEQVGATTATP